MASPNVLNVGVGDRAVAGASARARLVELGLDRLGGLVGRQLDRREVGDDVVELLVGERTTTGRAPRRHRRVAPAEVEDLLHLLRRVAVHDRVERRGLPRHLGHEVTGGRVGDGVVGHAADARRAVAAGALGRVHVDVLAAGDEGVLEALHRVGLATGFGQPVERQGDGDDAEHHQAEPEGAVELLGLELVVGHARLAVGRELELRADLGPTPAHVHQDGDRERRGSAGRPARSRSAFWTSASTSWSLTCNISGALRPRSAGLQLPDRSCSYRSADPGRSDRCSPSTPHQTPPSRNDPCPAAPDHPSSPPPGCTANHDTGTRTTATSHTTAPDNPDAGTSDTAPPPRPPCPPTPHAGYTFLAFSNADAGYCVIHIRPSARYKNPDRRLDLGDHVGHVAHPDLRPEPTLRGRPQERDHRRAERRSTTDPITRTIERLKN